MEVVYPCSICTKSFKTKKYFLLHMKAVHQYDSPSKDNDEHKNIFACSQCSKEFNSKCLLNKHVHIKHKNLKHLTDYTSMKKSNGSHEHSIYNCLLLKVSTYNVQFELNWLGKCYSSIILQFYHR